MNIPPPGPWIVILLVVVGVALALGIVYVASFLSFSRRRANLWLGLFGISTSVMALSEAWIYHLGSPATYCSAVRWTLVATIPTAIFLLLVVAEYVDGLRRAIKVWAVAGIGLIPFLLASECGTFERVTEVKQLVLPWGEQLFVGSGPITALGILVYLWSAGAGIPVLLAAGCVRAARTKPRREAALLSFVLVVLLVSVALSLLVDLQVIRSPYLYTQALVLILIIFSARAGIEVASGSKLTEVVISRERRWRALFDNASLLIARIDTRGRVESVNPFLLETAGRSERELVARDFARLVPSEERGVFAETLERTLAEGSTQSFDFTLRGKGGCDRLIVWRSVALHDEEGTVSGALYIGSDITEREQAAKARDEAMAKVEELLSQLEEENLYLKEDVKRTAGFEDIVGDSDAMLYVLQKVKQVAPLETSVLVQGPTGVGKELIARAIHDHSARRNKPFIKVNCAAFVAGLAESEFFGHEAGAFTGAQKVRTGRFEVASGGTLFLDEIGELPVELQPKLLRVLQSGEYERVGSSKVALADVRVIAATNRDLEADVETGRFRQDLLFRLNVFPISVPPLRERPSDIPLLVRYYVPRISSRLGRSVDEISAATMKELTAYQWPGNVRELLNVLERAVITGTGSRLDLASALGQSGQSPSGPKADSAGLSLAEVERDHIVAVLEASEWRISGPGGAAERLDLNPSTLRGRMRKLEIRRSAEARNLLKSSGSAIR